MRRNGTKKKTIRWLVIATMNFLIRINSAQEQQKEREREMEKKKRHKLDNYA